MNQSQISASLKALTKSHNILGGILTEDGVVAGECSSLGENAKTNLLHTLSEMDKFYRAEKREIQQFVFGYESASLLVLADGPFRLLLVQDVNGDISSAAEAGKAFLTDLQMSFFARKMAADFAAQTGARGKVKPKFASPAKKVGRLFQSISQSSILAR